jgi:hypothetical protein
MKKDIVTVREAITKVVSLLTRQAIKVQQRGVKAYVQYGAKGQIELVNLPYIPDDATEEFIAAVQGFLDHEVGHVLFTDTKVVERAKKAGSRVKNLHNVLEDVYIEQKMIEAFAGSVNNLESVRRFHAERMAAPKIKEAMATGDLDTAAGYVAPLQFRAWGGQLTARDFLTDNPKLAAMVEPMAKAIGPELIARVGKLKSSDDCLKLAIAIAEKTAPPPAPPPPPAPKSAPPPPPEEKPKKGDGEAEDSAPTEGGDGEVDKDDTKPDDKGKTSTEADDSDKERDEASKTEEEGEAGGDVKGDPEQPDGEKGEGGESSDPADESESKDPAASGDADDGETEEAEPASEGSGGDDDEPAEPAEPAADTAGEGDGEGESTEGEPGEPGELDSADAEASGEEGTGAEDDAGGKSETSGGTVDESDDETVSGAEEDLGELFESAHDFDDEASEALSEAAGKSMRAADYKVFSTDWDKVYEAPQATGSGSVGKMVDRVQHMVGGIQKQLERAMAAQDRKTWNPGQRRGRISPGSLFKTATGDDRVFRVRHETRAKNTAVSLLVDCSGSMSVSDRVGTAGMAAYALSSTLERLKIHHEVLGYTTAACSAMMREISSERAGIGYSRMEALRIPVFKSFHERLTTEAKSRLAHLTERPRWLRENVDGECLQIAAHRLLQQRAERHVLIVLSDGQPACAAGDFSALQVHLKAVAKDLEGKGVEVVGIGIQTDAVRRFYRNSLVLNNLEELPTTLVGQLSKILLAP